ncbi:MAG TPA: hypothetical protein VN643_06585 [Pyrinomonadaceae bacterium]|nr:hypothetical protein [Pyrinomonadaceae bacterium]
MLRNSIALVGGVLLSFALRLVGVRLAWIAIVGNVDYSENKHAIVRWLLWNMFAVAPAVAVVVGALVASIVRRSGWWLGGVAMLPLCIYELIGSVHTPDIVMSVAYIALAFGGAFVVSRFKRRSP